MAKLSKKENDLEKRIKVEVKPHIGKPLALSGGIDSSLLAALIKPKFAISVQLPGGDKYNEIKWAKIVTEHLGTKHIIVRPDASKFDEYVKLAVKAIGKPIPHFNIFPLYVMYKKLSEMGEKELVLGDGPDETMHGYGRDLIINYLYKVYEFESLKNYKELINKILPSMTDAIKATAGLSGFTDIVAADIEKRKEMDPMSDGIAKSFGIKNIRPYQDNLKMDNFMRDLPIEEKINGEYGKYALRKIAEKYLPKEVAWRKNKLGGPVYPVNLLKGWMDDGEFDKKCWMKYQENFLKRV